MKFKPVSDNELPELPDSADWFRSNRRWSITFNDSEQIIGLDRNGDVEFYSSEHGMWYLPRTAITALYLANGVPSPGCGELDQVFDSLTC